MRLEILKGTKDYLPQEQILINGVLDIIKNNYEKYGIRPFDTPIIEYFEILVNKYKSDDEIVQEIFKVKDRGNRNLGLRYDLTVPLCRFVASQKQLKLPFKRYQIGKVFRDGPIKKGRLREFIQCDADIIGISGEEIEAELLDLFYNTYKDLNIDVIIEINNIKILKGLLLEFGFDKEELQSLILSIDKLKKIGEAGVLEEIRKKNLDEEKAKKVLKILSLNKIETIKKTSKNDLLKKGLKELENLVELLEFLKVNYKVNLSLSRGLAIYSGNVWEAFDVENIIVSSLGAGGRYDEALLNFSNNNVDLSAVGISFGIVPITEILAKKRKLKNGVTNILVVPLEKELIKVAQKQAKKLREKSNVEVFYDLKLKKAFSYAEYLGAKYIAIIGKKDYNNGEYTLKDIISGKEIKKKLVEIYH